MLRSRCGIVACLLATADALAKWNVALNLGREPGSSMPESWAASGARFFLQTQVEFGDDPATEESFLGRGRAPRLVTAETASFTGVGGRREVAVGSGAWVLARDRAPAVLRFWLDFSSILHPFWVILAPSFNNFEGFLFTFINSLSIHY